MVQRDAVVRNEHEAGPLGFLPHLRRLVRLVSAHRDDLTI
jgi:hypothetical protein